MMTAQDLVKTLLGERARAEVIPAEVEADLDFTEPSERGCLVPDPEWSYDGDGDDEAEAEDCADLSGADMVNCLLGQDRSPVADAPAVLPDVDEPDTITLPEEPPAGPAGPDPDDPWRPRRIHPGTEPRPKARSRDLR